MHWLPYAVLAGFGFAVFLPNMRKKDESLSRYPGFAAYRERSGLLLPRGCWAETAQPSSTATQRPQTVGWAACWPMSVS